MKRANKNWNPLSYNNYGVEKPLVNRNRNYTLLYNTVTGEYVVAYCYDSTDNTWGQGHYFHDFYKALEFMYASDED